MERIKPIRAEGIKIIPIDELNTDIKISVARNVAELGKRRCGMNSINGQYPVFEREVAGRMVLISAKDFEVYQEPQKSRSSLRKSEALYIARSKYISPAVQVYFLPESKQASFHYHREHLEEFFMIDGEADAEIDNQRIVLPQSLKIESWQPHRATAGLGGAIITVVTSGSSNCFSMSDHHYIESYQDFLDNHLPQKSPLL
jgi:quercetin dioxygenase-like cupin family protein